MLFAITRAISGAFERCELSHQPRRPIDLPRARAQHDAYEWALVELGCTVRRLASTPDMPDAVFVEDAAVVFPEVAVVTRPGAASRRVEIPLVVEALGRFGLPLRDIVEPGSVDGGDVLVIGRDVFVGSSARTNAAGTQQLQRLLEPLAYRLRVVPVRGCLHLKSAVTAVGTDTVLINPQWVPVDAFEGLTTIAVDPDEPDAANALLVGQTIIYPAAYPKTRARLEQHGMQVRAVEVDELAKGEGGVTCCSVIFDI